MDYLVFDTEAAAQTALDAIYANMVAAIPSPDLLDVTTDQEIPQVELDDNERAEYAADNRRFPIFGVNAATQVKDTEEGYTTAWAEIAQTVQGKWVFPKPDDAMLDGVTGYTVEPYDPGWFPKVELNG
jgi:hypothetical protein